MCALSFFYFFFKCLPCCDGDWFLFSEISVVRLTLRCVIPQAMVLWDDFFCLICSLFILWFSFLYSATLQHGSTLERSAMNTAFILLASAPLVYLLSVAARAVSLCLALSQALHLDIQMYFFSRQDMTLICSPLCG